MALYSQLDDAGVEFAENLDDFYRPTFDTRFEHVYALAIVGINPASNRSCINTIRDFVALANAHKKNIATDGINHCSKKRKRVVTNNSCIEPEAFVAIHFDSFCGYFCDAQFCVSPRSTTVPDYNSMDLANLQQYFKDAYTGSCFVHNMTNHVYKTF